VSSPIIIDPEQDERVVGQNPVHFPQTSLTRRFFKNSIALAIGWNISAIGRLIAAGMVVRSMGVDVFGGYALLIVWLTIAEWILDFGTVEVFVREANDQPQQRNHLVRVLLAMKTLQAPLAWLVLTSGLIVMHYSHQILLAGMIGGIGLFFTAGVVLCRAVFKCALTMEREVVSEFISVLVMLPLILLVARSGLGLMGVMATYAISRAVFCAGCLFQARGLIDFSVRGVKLLDLRFAARSSVAIGVVGFIVVLYNGIDLLVLSRAAHLSDVAVYSAALRFTMPVTMALNAIAVSVYPVLALLKSREEFHNTCQHAINTTLLLGCAALIGIWCSGEFLMSLLGKQLVPGANLLRILALVCVVKAVPMVIGPALFLVRAQRYALRYMVAALLLKVVVLVAATLKFGYLGAGFGTLAVETFFLTPVTMHYVRRFTGFKTRFSSIWKLVPVVAGTIWLVRTLMPSGSLASGIVAVLLYVLLVLGLRIVKQNDLQRLLRRT
jgi:O-antigen/teichoic acid export membrane protein